MLGKVSNGPRAGLWGASASDHENTTLLTPKS